MSRDQGGIRAREHQQEALQQEALQQEALQQEALQQEALQQEALQQEALQQEALQQEARAGVRWHSPVGRDESEEDGHSQGLARAPAARARAQCIDAVQFSSCSAPRR